MSNTEIISMTLGILSFILALISIWLGIKANNYSNENKKINYYYKKELPELKRKKLMNEADIYLENLYKNIPNDFHSIRKTFFNFDLKTMNIIESEIWGYKIVENIEEGLASFFDKKSVFKYLWNDILIAEIIHVLNLEIKINNEDFEKLKKFTILKENFRNFMWYRQKLLFLNYTDNSFLSKKFSDIFYCTYNDLYTILNLTKKISNSEMKKINEFFELLISLEAYKKTIFEYYSIFANEPSLDINYFLNKKDIKNFYKNIYEIYEKIYDIKINEEIFLLILELEIRNDFNKIFSNKKENDIQNLKENIRKMEDIRKNIFAYFKQEGWIEFSFTNFFKNKISDFDLI